MSQDASAPAAAPAAPPLVAFTATDLLDRFCQFVKRSPSLDGSLPMRAAQHCTPVMEGSSAGMHVVLRRPFSIKQRKSGYHLQMSSMGLESLSLVEDAVERAVERGAIRRNGYWHKLLSEGGISLQGNKLVIWTGFLIEPAEDVWLLVSGAYNRRSRIEVTPHVVASKAAVPLVIECDLKATRFEGDLWLQDELACVLPVRPRVKMRLTKLDKNELDVARSFLDYYDASYQQEKAQHATARYRRLNGKAPREIAPNGDSRVVCFGPAVNKVRTFTRFASEVGFTKTPTLPGNLEYVEVCNGPKATFTFDGNSTETINSGLDKYLKPIEKFFARHFPERIGTIPSVDDYLASGSRGEPILGLVPWAFTVTPSGWSSVVDAYHHATLDADGMRGVISTDWFHALGNVLQLHRPGTFTLKKGIPMMRVLPVPRDLLKATWRETPRDEEAEGKASPARRSARASEVSP